MDPIELPAGMELVETKPESAAIDVDQINVAPPPRRPRPSRVVEEAVDDEPLVQIETGKPRSADSVENA